MFYLLKSIQTENKISDVIIKKSAIEAIRGQKIIEDEKIFFVIQVEMTNGDSWCGLFDKEEDCRQVISELTDNFDPDNKFSFRIFDRDKDKKDGMEGIFDKIKSRMFS